MKIYNTMTRRKEDFVPITPGEIKMYTCGQTVYNDIHIGNARFYVAFDAIRRYMEYKGYRVRFVQNFTDVDDKIIRRASEEKITPQEVAEKYIRHTLEDTDALSVTRATVNPLATEEMPEIIKMVQTLVDKGFAYAANGHVFFDTSKSAEYGKLSKKQIDELEAGARVEVNPDKRSPMDFVLWKPDKPGDPKWESPWGTGRPGWHIECSTMAKKYLGETIDIHGGGQDLMFPHHENEIAQSEAANGAEFARYWMHSGIITSGHKKMSKSVGNFSTLREVAEKFPYDVIRFFFLSGHYRMPIEYSEELLASAQSGLTRIKNARGALAFIMENTEKPALSDAEKALLSQAERFPAGFEAAMDDDFNTADAITAIFELVRFIHSNTDVNNPGGVSRAFAEALMAQTDKLCGILGFDLSGPQQTDAEVEALIAQRQAARKNKDWAAADRIRDELNARGIVLEDTAGGVRWSYKK
ncbi:MAG: cysteine--tRNA ligase [Clostridiales bacterium]|jgi:cysteinyl-tRNA synthetase|nr:cysteine--tRNA ligase [Clostridiales bacterium]